MRQRADGVETGDAIGGGDHGASDGLFDPIGEEAIDGGAPNFEVAIDALTEREGDVEDDRDQMREDEGLVSRLDEANGQVVCDRMAGLGKSFREHAQPFFTKHCVRCHGDKKAEAKLRLDTLAADFVNRPASDQWVEVLDRLNLGDMPPEGEPQPPAADLVRVTDWITDEMTKARGRAQATGGRVSFATASARRKGL